MSSPVRFEVVPDHVQDAGRYIQEVAAALVAGVRAADVEVSGLMSSWKGAAASAYQAGWEETRNGAVEVLEALGDMAELLGVVAAALPEIDQS
ncbi:WXG100 family type VII secretion target, partial [Streptomyces roseolus]|uniref:WXG100 family type VII secretion target n=1 Tax=Streptomyces roseolus TaxID=67358 RepID=UPI0036699AA6